MNRGKSIHQRPTIEWWASIDKVLCWPATTPNEYIQYQCMNWWYDYDTIGRKYNWLKKEILESLTEQELRSMIAEKRMNVEFNEKLVHYKYPIGSPDEIQFLYDLLNKKYIELLNEPLIKCILTFDRELRTRSDIHKEKQIDLVELKSRVDILEVVQSFVSLGRYKPGQLIKCPLPMHKDKTASCMLYHKNNTFYCHGCHSHGSQLDFIMLMKWCSLWDAIKILSNF